MLDRQKGGPESIKFEEKKTKRKTQMNILSKTRDDVKEMNENAHRMHSVVYVI